MLARATKEKQKNEARIQQEAISSDMLKLKDKCDQVQQVIDIMEKEYVDSIERAEAGNNMSLVIKGNVYLLNDGFFIFYTLYN